MNFKTWALIQNEVITPNDSSIVQLPRTKARGICMCHSSITPMPKLSALNNYNTFELYPGSPMMYKPRTQLLFHLPEME